MRCLGLVSLANHCFAGGGQGHPRPTRGWASNPKAPSKTMKDWLAFQEHPKMSHLSWTGAKADSPLRELSRSSRQFFAMQCCSIDQINKEMGPVTEPRQACLMKMKLLVEAVESRFIKQDLPTISIGDTVKIGIFIQEGNKQRVQPYQGTVIAKHRAGVSTTVTVRRVFQGVGVERVFAVHSPSIQSIDILRRSKVRRAKLYYLRERVGKGTRLAPKLSV